MGFIQESEYRARLAAIGVASNSTANAAAAAALGSSRDRLISSFDAAAFGSSAAPQKDRTLFQRVEWHGTLEADRVACARCGVELPRALVDSDDHRVVCHVDARPDTQLDFACPLAHLGCGARLTARTWSPHISRECDYAAVVCRCVVDSFRYAQLYNWGAVVCQEERLREPLLAHMASVHSVLMPATGESTLAPPLQPSVACPLAADGCRDRVPLAQLADHLLVCPVYKLRDPESVASLAGAKTSQRAPLDEPRDAQRCTDRVSLHDFWAEFDAASDDETDHQEPSHAGFDTPDVPCNRLALQQYMMDFHKSRGEPSAGHVPARLPCPLCSRRVGRNRLGRHLLSCAAYDVSCPRCHQDIGQRRLAENHLCSPTASHQHAGAMLATLTEDHLAKHRARAERPEPPREEYVRPSQLPSNNWW